MFTKKASAGGGETAGKILTGVIIGPIATEALRTPPPVHSRPQYYEYRVYVSGYWQESYAIELIPGYWDEVWIRREDGSVYRDKVWVPPTTRMVPMRTWVPGRWEERRGKSE
ncbi:MAG TPA: hypothetical protein PKM17_13895 [Syntrophorhabdus sp.]|nr:hypothetical protein [Syntrophorhabdus sp.]